MHLEVNRQPVAPNTASFHSRSFYFKVLESHQNLAKFLTLTQNLLDDLHAGNGLPTKQTQNHHIQKNMGVTSPIMAFLHKGRQTGRNRHLTE